MNKTCTTDISVVRMLTDYSFFGPNVTIFERTLSIHQSLHVWIVFMSAMFFLTKLFYTFTKLFTILMYTNSLKMLKSCSNFATKSIFDPKYWFQIDKISLLASLEWKNSIYRILLNRKSPLIKLCFMLISYSDFSHFRLEILSPLFTVDKWTLLQQSSFIFRNQIYLIMKFYPF